MGRESMCAALGATTPPYGTMFLLSCPTLTERDVIVINFGAWYPRFNYNEPRVSLPYVT